MDLPNYPGRDKPVKTELPQNVLSSSHVRLHSKERGLGAYGISIYEMDVTACHASCPTPAPTPTTPTPTPVPTPAPRRARERGLGARRIHDARAIFAESGPQREAVFSADVQRRAREHLELLECSQ